MQINQKNFFLLFFSLNNVNINKKLHLLIKHQLLSILFVLIYQVRFTKGLFYFNILFKVNKIFNK